MVSYPKDWETKQVKDFGYVVTGNTHQAPMFQNIGVGRIRG